RSRRRHVRRRAGRRGRRRLRLDPSRRAARRGAVAAGAAARGGEGVLPEPPSFLLELAVARRDDLAGRRRIRGRRDAIDLAMSLWRRSAGTLAVQAASAALTFAA